MTFSIGIWFNRMSGLWLRTFFRIRPYPGKSWDRPFRILEECQSRKVLLPSQKESSLGIRHPNNPLGIFYRICIPWNLFDSGNVLQTFRQESAKPMLVVPYWHNRPLFVLQLNLSSETLDSAGPSLAGSGLASVSSIAKAISLVSGGR